jgi:phenylalanyl-tRNA synthetase beta chain
MKLPISWINEFVKFPKNTKTETIVENLVKLGYEVESVEIFGDVQGPLVVGKVEKIEILSEFKKPIRYCQVKVGNKTNGIICGASNFNEGDLVVVALPGAVLPGDFKISQRETYGKISQGMICSAKELGFSDNHEGIIVLNSDFKVGANAKEILGLGETVLDIAVLPDRGYAMSIRGIGRELALAMNVKYIDPISQKVPKVKKSSKIKANIKTPKASKLALVSLSNYDTKSETPLFMQRRLAQAGFRSISLPVDVTNYLMLEIGQPLHAFDADKVNGSVIVRNAKNGETLETLDHVKRKLVENDLVIADSKKVLSVAGVMGGLESEISDNSKNLIIESAVFDKGSISKTSRNLKLPSEASKRFERGTDPSINEYAAILAAHYLAKYGKAKINGISSAKKPIKNQSVIFSPQEVNRLIGVDIEKSIMLKILKSLDMKISKIGKNWKITPPTWRHDINLAADLVEEIIRIWGYHKIPSQLPKTNIGNGLSPSQKIKRSLSVKMASMGLNEILNYPFISLEKINNLGIKSDDERQNLVRLANPLSEDLPYLRSTLIPGLFEAVIRNISRGNDNLALFEQGSVYLKPIKKQSKIMPQLLRRPSSREIQLLDDLIPDQPKMISAILTGEKYKSGWWPNAQKYNWHDPIEMVARLCEEYGIKVSVKNANNAPFHPGRCAEISIGEKILGYAGEFNPSVLEKIGINGKVYGFEIEADLIVELAQVIKAPVFSSMPVVKEDLAFVVAKSVTAIEVIETIKKSSGDLLESVRLFDVYEGSNVGEDKKSLAFSLRFRAFDRTLNSEEISTLRGQIIEAVQQRHRGSLRA